jgi:hypothetical protein
LHRQNIGLQAYRLTGLQAYRLTGLQAYRLTGLQAYRLTGLQADRELYGGESKIALKIVVYAICIILFGSVIFWRGISQQRIKR